MKPARKPSGIVTIAERRHPALEIPLSMARSGLVHRSLKPRLPCSYRSGNVLGTVKDDPMPTSKTRGR
jgi:hypothetical protein